MDGDEARRRPPGPGGELFEQARRRAESLLREMSHLGEATQQQAGERAEGLWAAGRWGADQLVEVIRREIAAQLGALGLATKADLEAMEQRLASRGNTADATGTPGAAKKAAPTRKATPAKKAPAAKKSPSARKAAKRPRPGGEADGNAPAGGSEASEP